MKSDVVPLVSVIIPARDEQRHIEACIRALQQQTYPPGQLEFIVSDGSADATSEILAGLAQREPRLRVLRNSSGSTPVGLNLAIEQARGSVICRMDAHAVPSTDYIERCVDVQRRSGAWAVGGRMVKAGVGRVGVAIAAASSSPFGVGDSAFHYAITPRSVDSVYLGCWPRAVFERVGTFDEELSRNQDDELSYRIREAGGTIWFDPSISVTYRPRETFAGLFEQHRQYGFWKIRVFQKHPRAMRWRHLVPAAFVLAVAAAPLGLFRRGALVLGAGTAAMYLLGATVASLRIARRKPVRVRNVILAFAAMHTGYGIGTWQGLAHLIWGKRRSPRPGQSGVWSS